MGIEIVNDDIEFTRPGRPMEGRSTELYKMISETVASGDMGFKCDLQDDETDKFFYRFTQRCRSAAKRAGVRVNVSIDRADRTKGVVRILSEEE